MSDRRLTSTYRLQLHAGFPFAAAEEVVPYLADLGVSHLYLSPVLQAAPGSMHGYDVVDHGRVSEDLGGEAGLRRLADTAHAAGLGLVVDVVPNHMAIPTPAWLNHRLWDVLKSGRASAYAHWFDVDWDLCEGRIGLPVLGEPLDDALAAGALALDAEGDERVVRYRGGQAFPVAPGTAGGSVADVLARQHYALASWREKETTLGYRRFFDVDTLIAVRVELPDVFEATHRLLLDLHGDGVVDGFRIDHPDGLADPEEYLERLRDATKGAWVVVEKILVGDESLPSSWACHGTTGYDAIRAVQAPLVPPTGAALDELWGSVTGNGGSLADTERTSKALVVRDLLAPEVSRLARRAHEATRAVGVASDPADLHAGFAAMLEHVDVYRAYVRLDQPVGAEAAARLDSWHDAAVAARPELAEAVGVIGRLVADSTSADPATRDLVVRFQQVCGPVMAKGVEDTTFYRWNRLISLNEVGGNPLDTSDDGAAVLDAWAARQGRDHPAGLTALSTHDTKRDEDVRSRIVAAAADVAGWTSAWGAVRAAAGRHGVDEPTAYLLMQTLVGAWPIGAERLLGYVEKAAREAKAKTGWTDDPAYEQRLRALARDSVEPGPVADLMSGWVAELDAAATAVGLGAKLVQLTLPGAPDVYQGCDAVTRSLVDPDNRRPVDYGLRARRLAALDAGEPPAGLDDLKLWVTSRVLRVRRERPELFASSAPYGRLDVGDPRMLAFLRGTDVATVVTRWPPEPGVSGDSGRTEAMLELPLRGPWTDVLTGARHDGSAAVPIAGLLSALPVALLVREQT